MGNAKSPVAVGNPIEAIWSRFLHIGILLYKNTLLSIRNWKTTVLRIVCPSLLIVALFLVQFALRSTNNIHPPTTDIGGIPKNMFHDHSTLLYAPKSRSIVHDIMKIAAESNDPILTIDAFNTATDYTKENPCTHDVCGFETEEQLFWYLFHVAGISGAVQFDTSSALSYKIWYNQTALRTTAWIPLDDPIMFFDFRPQIQKAVDRSIMRHVSGNDAIDIDVHMKPLPNLASSQSNPEGLVESWGVFVWFLAVFISTLTVHHSVTYEREHKLREGMKMMGMHDVSYWTSWIIYHAVIEAIAMVLLIITGYLLGLSLFRSCNPLILFVVLYGMALSISTLWLVLSTIVRSERSTNITAFIVLLLSLPWLALWSNLGGPDLFPYKLIGYYIVEFEGLMWLVVNPVFTFGKLIADITLNTRLVFSASTNSWVSGPGFGFDDLWNRLFHDDALLHILFERVPVPLFSLGFVLLSIVINIILLWFCDNTVPSEYGLPRPPWFFLLPSYWGIQLHKGQLNIDLPSQQNRRLQEVLFDMDEDIFQEYEYVLNSVHEHDENVPVKIVKLSKTYGGRLLTRGLNNSNNTRALDSLCLSVNKGTVLALLGHNGAGKTTAINILTGLYGPSNGDALIYGHGVVNEIDDIRRIMGVCPQHDILWDELTAKEHMLMFALFKRVPWKDITTVIDRHLSEVNLLKVKNRRSKTYSGGMKRRLSVAISFMGAPKIVFLDEPTSGMDPIHKRQVWDLITKKKSDRVVVLTTHSMEEADMLGDKIAIMALGRLRAIGSSLHLKNRFGGGYTIRLVTEPQQSEVLKKKVVEMLPDIVLEIETAGSITYSLSRSSIGDSIALEVFFRFLEQESVKSKRQAALQYHNQLDKAIKPETTQCLIKDWSISHTTLTEVFLRLTHGDPRRFIKAPSASIPNQQGISPEGRAQLNVAWEGSVDAIGFIEIGDSTTLAGARQAIISELLSGMQQIPSDFVFLSGGVPVTQMQEPRKSAIKYLPLVLLRRVDGVVSADAGASSSSNNVLDDGRARITELETLTSTLQAQLQAEQQRTQELLQRIAHLEQLLTSQAPPQLSVDALPGGSLPGETS